MQPATVNSPATTSKRRPGRQPYASTVAELPIPPSANALWFNAPGRGRVRTDEYRSWIEAAGWELREQRVSKISGTVGLTVFAGLTKRARDLDNTLKSIGDLLQAHGVIEDDRNIVELFARWDRAVPSGRVRLELRQVLAPAQRMSPEARQRLSVQKRELQAWLRRQQLATAEKLAESAGELRARGEATGLLPSISAP